MARPRGRPPIGGSIFQLCRKIISRPNPPSPPASRGKAQLLYLSWKLYLKLYLSWKLLSIGFPQQTGEQPNLRPAAPQIQAASSIKFIFYILKKYFLHVLLLFSVRFIRIEHVPLHINGKSRERDFSGINLVFVESNFSNLMQMWGKCVKQTAGIRPLNGLGSSVGSFVGKNKSKKRIDRNLPGR